MRKALISQQLGIYFVATTLCLIIISTSIDGGLIKATYGYGYGYGYGSNKIDDNTQVNITDSGVANKNIVSISQEKKKKEKREEKKRLKNSRNTLKRGEILVQSGKGFKKNSKLKLYFSKSDGTFYPPVIVKTDSKGKFSIKYLATKPAGKYKWYAVVPASGKKTKVSSYTIVK